MSWRRKEPGQQQSRYLLRWAGIIRFPHVKGVKKIELRYPAWLPHVTHFMGVLQGL